MMAIYVFTFPKYRTEEVAESFFGVFYVAVMLSYLYQVRAMGDGKYLVWLIFLSSWGCDTSAYCRHAVWKTKLAPGLKPEEIHRGSCGWRGRRRVLGFLFATAFGGKMTELMYPRLACTLACAIAAVISQIGDLAASAIKRNHNIKLRQPDPGTRRRAGSVRQHDFYRTGNLLCPAVSAV